MVIHEGAKEILASAYHHLSRSARQSRDLYFRLGGRAFHLHAFLDTVSSERLAGNSQTLSTWYFAKGRRHDKQ